MRRELLLGPGTGETDAALRPAAGQDGAARLGARAGQETELPDTTLLGGLDRSFHGEC